MRSSLRQAAACASLLALTACGMIQFKTDDAPSDPSLVKEYAAIARDPGAIVLEVLNESADPWRKVYRVGAFRTGPIGPGSGVSEGDVKRSRIDFEIRDTAGGPAFSVRCRQESRWKDALEPFQSGWKTRAEYAFDIEAGDAPAVRFGQRESASERFRQGKLTYAYADRDFDGVHRSGYLCRLDGRPVAWLEAYPDRVLLLAPGTDRELLRRLSALAIALALQRPDTF